MNLRKIPLIFLVLAAVHVIAIFTAPYTIPPNTVSGLDGNANMIDSFDRWNDLNPYARVVYLFGDFNCHQIESRSFFLNGNQMPVCARDTGMALGFLIGSVLFLFTIPKSNPFVMFLTPFLREKAAALKNEMAILLAVIIGIVFMSPMAVDGLVQTASSYDSTNTIRFLTGLSFGWVLVLGMGVYLESYIYRHIYAREKPVTDVKNIG
jgi:uncharacterized membrane protein